MTRIDVLRASERAYKAFPRPRRITVRVKQINFHLPAWSTNAHIVIKQSLYLYSVT